MTGRNHDGDDEFKLITLIKSRNEEDKVGAADLVRFLWRNQASLVYSLSKSEGDRIDNAIMTNNYYEFCHDLLLDFGSFMPKKEKFAENVDFRRKSNLHYFLKLAFSDSNSIGKDYRKSFKEEFDEMDDETRAKVREHNARIQYAIDGLRASFAMFIVKVFAYDLYEMVCEQKHITNRWYKPAVVSKDVVDETESSYFFQEGDEGGFFAEMGEEECAA